MELRRELSLMMGTLVLLNVLLAFGVIGLFVRMGPAIERILRENVLSIVAAEEVLAAFAEADGGAMTKARRTEVEAAVLRAQSNQTEAEERPILESLQRNLDPALAADPVARSQLVADLRELIRINRTAMEVADLEAQRLGSAGAWAAVLVGVLSFGLSWIVLGRMRRRFVAPLLDLHAALEAARAGERFRRCHARAAPLEVRQVLDSVNRLLDERLTVNTNVVQRDGSEPAG